MPELLQFRQLEKSEVLPEGWTEGELSDGTPWIEVNAVLFYAGTHRDDSYDVNDLEQLAKSFSEPEGEQYSTIPIQLDHSSSTRDTVGDLRKVWVEGEELKGRLRFEGAENVRNVKLRRWRRLSISFYVQKGTDKEVIYTLREISVTPFPECTFQPSRSLIPAEADRGFNLFNCSNHGFELVPNLQTLR